MSVVQVENVSKSYLLGEQQVQALMDITLNIEDGAFLAIAGPSGSGKSTLLNLIGCIDTPTSGQIRINGQDVGGKTPDQLATLRARTIGFIFQTFNLFPVLTAEENVEYPLLQLRELGAAQRRERVAKYLSVVGLSKFADHRPNQLSGGQRQRVAIARALATQPKIVLADEPTANLDHNTGNGILQLMQEINREFKTTFVFSTHDLRVMTMANHLVRIEDGRLVGTETRETIAVTSKIRQASRPAAAAAVSATVTATTGKPAPAAVTTIADADIRERVNNYLYLEHSDIYMAAPWHINTDSNHWVVSRSSVEVGDAQEYIRSQLASQSPFYTGLHQLLLRARREGIKIDGWPA